MPAGRWGDALAAAEARESARSERMDPAISLNEWAQWISFNGLNYPFMLNTTGVGGKSENITRSFTAYVQMAYCGQRAGVCLHVAPRRSFQPSPLSWTRFVDGAATGTFRQLTISSCSNSLVGREDGRPAVACHPGRRPRWQLLLRAPWQRVATVAAGLGDHHRRLVKRLRQRGHVG